MAELRELDGKVSGVKEAWLNSVDEVKRIVSEKFSWFSLKEVPFTEVGCVSGKRNRTFSKAYKSIISWDKYGKTPENTCSGNFVYHGRRSNVKRSILLSK